MAIPYNKTQNRLRRLDETEVLRLGPPEELKALEGGFSARSARMQRHSKSLRKAGGRWRKSRRMKV